MTHQKLLRAWIVGLALTVLLSALAFAKGSGTVTLRFASSLGGTQIEAGEYQLSWEEHSPEATVTLAKGKKAVVTARGKLEERKVKYDRNMVVYEAAANGSQIIKELRLDGTNKAIVFSE